MQLIKMLRMLDMPIKEVGHVLNEEVTLKEAVEIQQGNLIQQQKQLQAAIDVCASIHKEKADTIDVEGYLQKMESMSVNGGVFAKIVDDYKQIASEEQERQFSFYTSNPVNTATTFEKALRKYAEENELKFQLVKGGMYPVFTLDGVRYTGARVLKREEETNSMTRIVCVRESSDAIKKEIPQSRRSVFQGVSRPECIEGLVEEKITWAKGWDWSEFQKSDMVCFASREFIDENGLELEQEVPFLVDRFVQDWTGVWLQRETLQPVTLKIVGICDFAGGEEETRVPEAVLPLKGVKQIFEINDKKYFASSL